VLVVRSITFGDAPIRPRIISLNVDDMHYARGIAEGRRHQGTPSNPDDSGYGAVAVDVVGVMAEMAVCLHYGEEYRLWVTAYKERPGAIPDIIHKGYRVSVKGTHRWERPLRLFVPAHDTTNDIYLLVSVDLAGARCGLQGWLTRRELLAYEPMGWQWTTDRPGSRKGNKRWRFVPVDDLRPCRETVRYEAMS
jgi:hypothetical protein